MSSSYKNIIFKIHISCGGFNIKDYFGFLIFIFNLKCFSLFNTWFIFIVTLTLFSFKFFLHFFCGFLLSTAIVHINLRLYLNPFHFLLLTFFQICTCYKEKISKKFFHFLFLRNFLLSKNEKWYCIWYEKINFR